MSTAPSPRPRGLVILRTLVLTAGAALLLGLLVLAAVAAWYARDLPPLDKATDYRPNQHLQVLTADGVEIAQFGAERRVFVPLAQMPMPLRKAVLATEDRQFYEHSGVSWRGLARATVANLTGGVPQGASTITQQVARTFFLSTRRTPERKLKEAMLAWRLEDKLSKDQILELYLNQIYLGQRAYGFGAAAQAYFGRPLESLSLAETALLAGLPQNPIHANPVTSPERAAKRQRWVLSRMLLTQDITQAEHDAALAERLRFRKPSQVDLPAQHVAEMARKIVVDRFGEQAYTDGLRVHTSVRAEDQRAAHQALRRAVMLHERKQPWRGPEDQETLPDDPVQAERAIAAALKDARDDDELRAAVVLSASPREVQAQLASGEVISLQGDALKWLQVALGPKATEKTALRRGSVIRLVAVPAAPVRARKSSKGAAPEVPRPPNWTVAQWPEAEAAFVALDPATGRIRALVGGFDFNRQQFNRVTSAWRQPGSSFKPFLYSAAFENGVMPETLVNDAPLLSPDGGTPTWNPQNSDGQFDGEMTVHEALVKSKNLVSIRILEHIGLGAARNWVTRFGFDADKQPDNLTFALGAGSTTPLQLAAAYAVLANGGHRVEPVLVDRIFDAKGTLLFEAPPPAPLGENTRVLPERNVFLVNTLLRDVTLRGTAARAQATLQRGDLYGKTGTTNDAVDAWFAGFQPGVVAVAWMGYDEPRSLGDRETGGGLALPIWTDAMAKLLRGVRVQPLQPVDGVMIVGEQWRYANAGESGFVPRIVSPSDALPVVAPATAASAAWTAPGASAPR
ncbi:MAG: PBP1A family penicillin-binding protein [Chitinophagaceae bacterium]|nr:PBP1A family penicillin-binding protein [Rubrivivax sp.]